ncbi:hypothetical protein DM02DRAFT_626360 [Periconia macrospinosa]|uniref:Apple domain-containing protein n=1 Tax=Periconia macrospinosa TaxID=97972 RepID=A0A2V1DXQ4_9PLEO|nr:hypothetical protein DM02DRAFT_626360 [Periconia macrospinosa]
MKLLRHSFLLPVFVHGALGNYDTFNSLCPGKHGEKVSLSAGEYSVSCGGHFDWWVTGERVDSQGTNSPEACARLCSLSVDCDAMIFDGGACWEYSAQGQTLAPESDPQGSTILLQPIVKINPNGPGHQTPQHPPPQNPPPQTPPPLRPPPLRPPPLTPEQLQQQLNQCIQEKDQLVRASQQDKQALINERDTCIHLRDQYKREMDACLPLRDQYKQEKDACLPLRDQYKREWDTCVSLRDQYKQDWEKSRNPPTPPPGTWKNEYAGLKCPQDNYARINTGTKRFQLRCKGITTYPQSEQSKRQVFASVKLFVDCAELCQADASCRGFDWSFNNKTCTLWPFVVRESDLSFSHPLAHTMFAGVTL